jgi:hypothetical protein
LTVVRARQAKIVAKVSVFLGIMFYSEKFATGAYDSETNAAEYWREAMPDRPARGGLLDEVPDYGF